jgi:Carboxypeptidase regulatory-like domain/TonB dependent receptor
MKRRTLFWPAIFACISAFLMLDPAWSQITEGTFRGVITDPSGAVVAGARVELRDTISGAARETTSNNSGEYLFPSVPPGVYSLTVSLPGFETLHNDEVTLQVGQQATLDFRLRPGDLKQVVTVRDQASLLNVTNATIGTVVDGEKVTQLPLNGRQFTQLILLTPGAAPQNTGLQGSYDVATNLGAVSPAVNGARSEMNNFTIDGVENNELYFNFVALNPPPDAIREFKVQSDMSSGAFGRAAGANVNVVTRSGTNEYHATLWEFLRNTSLDARDFFNPTRSVFHQNQYGFTAGGPIRKQKVFGFGWWEGFRKRLGSSIVGTVPTPAQLAGDLSGLPPVYNPFSTRQIGTDAQGNPIFTRDPFPGNQIPKGMLNSAAVNIASVMFPAPNLQRGSAANYINTQPLTTDSDQFGVRIDALLPADTNFFGRYSYSNAALSSPQLLPVLPTQTRNRMQQAVVGLTRALSPTSVVDFHAQFLRTSLLIYNPAPAPATFLQSNGLEKDFPPPTGIPPFMPGICMSDSACYGAQTYGPIAPINSWEFNGSYTKIVRKHNLSFGANFIHTFFYENYNYGGANFDNLPTSDPQNSANSGSGLASFLLGVPSSANQFVGSYEFTGRGNYYGVFANDEWQIDRRLVLTLGLRYDYSAPFTEAHGHLASLDWDNSTPTNTIWLTVVRNPITGAPANAPDGIYFPNRTNFGPRVGIAYRLRNDLVLRTGYGLFYDFNQSNIQDQQDTVGLWPWGAGDFEGNLNLPTAAQPTPTRLLGTGIFPPFMFPSSPPYAPGFVANRHNRTPYVQTWNLGIDKSYGNNWLVSVTYLGSKGTHLPIEFPVNTARTPGPGPLGPRQRLPQFAPLTIDGNWSNSSYQAGEIKIEKRTSSGLAFLTSYSYSKSLDVSSTVHGTSQPYNGVQDSFNIRGSRGPSDFDLTHNFVTSVVYDLPIGEGRHFLNNHGVLSRYLVGGWQATTIISLNSGFPFSLSVPYDNANVGGGAQRPTLSGNLLPPGFKQTPNAWFNVNAVTVVPYAFGNLGRNVLRQNGFKEVDAGAFKQFPITETRKLEFRTEVFNLLNHPSFGAPDTSVGSPTFGQVLKTIGLPRVIQFGLKLNF